MFDDVVGFDQVTDAKIHPAHFGPRILPPPDVGLL